MFSILKQIIITSRPFGWIIFMISYLAGFILTKESLNLQNWLTLLIVGPILSFVIYTFNDIYDYGSDILNDRKKLLIMGGVLDKKYWSLFQKISMILIILIIFTPVWFSNYVGLLCAIFGLFVGLGYSIPPLRLKIKLGGDILCNSLGFLSLFVWGLSQNLSANNLFYSLKYALYSTLMVIVWSLLFLTLDYKYDKKAKHKTTAVRFSQIQALIFSGVGYGFCGILMIILFNQIWIAILLAICSIAILFGIIFKTSRYQIFLAIFVTFLSVVAYSSLYVPIFLK